MPRLRAGAAAVAQCPLRRRHSRSKRAGCSARSPPARRGSGSDGRLVIRNSGTEPVIRVMAQGEDEALADQRRRRDLRGDPGGRARSAGGRAPAGSTSRRRNDARAADEGAGSDRRRLGFGRRRRHPGRHQDGDDARRLRRHRGDRADRAEHRAASSACCRSPPTSSASRSRWCSTISAPMRSRPACCTMPRVIETVAAVLAERAPRCAAGRRSGDGGEGRGAARSSPARSRR